MIFQCIENARAHNHALRLLGSIDHRAFVGRREEQYPLLAKQRIEVVQCISGSIFILTDKDMHTALAGNGCRHIK